MKKIVSFLGLVVILALSAISFFAIPGQSASPSRANRAALDRCAQTEIALDEGYGVSRRVAQTDCLATSSITPR